MYHTLEQHSAYAEGETACEAVTPARDHRDPSISQPRRNAIALCMHLLSLQRIFPISGPDGVHGMATNSAAHHATPYPAWSAVQGGHAHRDAQWPTASARSRRWAACTTAALVDYSHPNGSPAAILLSQRVLLAEPRQTGGASVRPTRSRHRKSPSIRSHAIRRCLALPLRPSRPRTRPLPRRDNMCAWQWCPALVAARRFWRVQNPTTRVQLHTCARRTAPRSS